MEFVKYIPLVFTFGYAVAASLTKDDVKEIKYLLWAGLFLLASIADAVV
jgi:hypothetical protein